MTGSESSLANAHPPRRACEWSSKGVDVLCDYSHARIEPDFAMFRCYSLPICLADSMAIGARSHRCQRAIDFGE